MVASIIWEAALSRLRFGNSFLEINESIGAFSNVQTDDPDATGQTVTGGQVQLNRRQGGLVVFYGDGLVRNLGGERLIFSRIGQRRPMMEPVETVELPEVPRERKRGFDLQRGFSEVYHAQDSGES